MKEKPFLLILGRVLVGLAPVVVVLGVVTAISTANGLHGVMPLVYGLGGQGLGDLMAELLRPLLTSFSWLIGLGGIILAVLLFATGQVVLHVQSLSVRLAVLED